MREFIESRIIELASGFSGRTKYRRPLVGFVSARDPRFELLKKVTHAGHVLPEDILPGAKSVAAFFLPFAAEIIEANRQGDKVAREWALAYIETNRFISEICSALQQELALKGIRAGFVKATHNFDEKNLLSFLSHKHVAWAAGLGTFGANHLLITAAGCGGRFGSLVLDHTIGAGAPPIPVKGCLLKGGRKCGRCVENCPTGALSLESLDKHKCYAHLLEVAEEYSELGLCDVCGKCAVGPCALQNF
ncbi:MAG: epoxyqueuosine reductase [Firmicutes bacterium]|nr:epoxyqueuosine reductase [Bacillota bacterium]